MTTSGPHSRTLHPRKVTMNFPPNLEAFSLEWQNATSMVIACFEILTALCSPSSTLRNFFSDTTTSITTISSSLTQSELCFLKLERIPFSETCFRPLHPDLKFGHTVQTALPFSIKVRSFRYQYFKL